MQMQINDVTTYFQDHKVAIHVEVIHSKSSQKPPIDLHFPPKNRPRKRKLSSVKTFLPFSTQLHSDIVLILNKNTFTWYYLKYMPACQKILIYALLTQILSAMIYALFRQLL